MFAVGLGLPDGVMPGLLVRVASSSADYLCAPDGTDLEGTYCQIAGRIAECP